MGLTLRNPLRPSQVAPPWLRPALPQDAPALGAILADWAEATPWMPRNRHLRSEAAARGALLIARTQVIVAGPGALQPPARHGLSALAASRRAPSPEDLPPLGFLARRDEVVHALYLAPQVRRQGLGSALLHQAKRDASRLTLWVFTANHAARAFYAAHGFEVVEAGDGSGNDEGLPELRLEWRRTDRRAAAQALDAAGVHRHGVRPATLSPASPPIPSTAPAPVPVPVPIGPAAARGRRRLLRLARKGGL